MQSCADSSWPFRAHDWRWVSIIVIVIATAIGGTGTQIKAQGARVCAANLSWQRRPQVSRRQGELGAACAWESAVCALASERAGGGAPMNLKGGGESNQSYWCLLDEPIRGLRLHGERAAARAGQSNWGRARGARTAYSIIMRELLARPAHAPRPAGRPLQSFARSLAEAGSARPLWARLAGNDRAPPMRASGRPAGRLAGWPSLAH